MRGQSKAIRGLAVVAVALSPLAAVDANAAVETGDANAGGPGIAVENTGGNVEIGKGHVESRVVTGNPSSAPAAPTGLSTLSTPAAKKVAPSNDASARAKAIVDAARARAQAQIDAARRQAEEAVARAKQQADEARAHSSAQSDEARAHSSDASASSHASSSTDD